MEVTVVENSTDQLSGKCQFDFKIQSKVICEIIPLMIMNVTKFLWILCETNLWASWVSLTHFVFNVADPSIDNTCTMRFCVSIATNIVDIVIAIIASSNSNIDYFCIFFVLCICITIVQSSCITLQSIFLSIITIFNRISDILIIVAKFVLNCIISLNNCCRSYYKFLCLYCCSFKHSRMALLSINQCALIIYDTIETTKQNVKDVIDKHRKKTTQNDKNIHFHRCMRCTSMDCILILMADAICTKYSIYELIDDSYIRFITIILNLIKYVIVLCYQRHQATQSSLFSIDWIVRLFLSCLWQLTIGCTLNLTLFILMLHIILSYGITLSGFPNNLPTKQDSECMDMSGDEIVDASLLAIVLCHYITNCLTHIVAHYIFIYQ